MQHLQPNTTLQGGKYRIVRMLGQGGFGITYLAKQTSLNRHVAVKEFFMRDFCSRDTNTMYVQSFTAESTKQVEQYRKKFIKEATNLARLNHPHIISVIDVFEESNTVYYVMPYLSGGSLQDYVKTHGTLSEQEAMGYVKQIAGALKYMHDEEHICHFDVKPANILLDDKGNAVLIDFGISKNYDAYGHETSMTPIGLSDGYAPIEQYQQNVEEFSPVSDVYALGATLYFLLHSKRPVSAVQRAGGAPLLMRKSLSPKIKEIINASMKLVKRERANSVDVFLGNTENLDESTIIDKNNSSAGERTIIDKAGYETTIIEGKRGYYKKNNEDAIRNNAYDLRHQLEEDLYQKKYFLIGALGGFIGLIVGLIVGLQVMEEIDPRLFPGLFVSFLLGFLAFWYPIRIFVHFKGKYNVKKWKEQHLNDPRSKYL